MNGSELAREVRKQSPRTRLLLTSGGMLQTALEPNSDFLPKPFDPGTLLATVRSLLAPPNPE